MQHVKRNFPAGLHAELEFERLTAALLAAEDWAPSYANAPKEHALLIKNTARLERLIMIYFRELAKRVPRMIDWYAYSRGVSEQKSNLKSSEVLAYDVNVVVNDDAVQEENQSFIKLVFDTVSTVTNLGVASMETETGLNIGLDSTHNIIQQLTTKQLANLVGMKVDPVTKNITPNPDPEYSIDETTRTKIANSIQKSINLGYNQQEAAGALSDVIADPQRAETIARTETVRAYENGRLAYAQQSNAVGKYWQTSGATDFCLDNAAEGTIGVDQAFASGDQAAPAHTNCKCQTSYTYNTAK